MYSAAKTFNSVKITTSEYARQIKLAVIEAMGGKDFLNRIKLTGGYTQENVNTGDVLIGINYCPTVGLNNLGEEFEFHTKNIEIYYCAASNNFSMRFRNGYNYINKTYKNDFFISNIFLNRLIPTFESYSGTIN